MPFTSMLLPCYGNKFKFPIRLIDRDIRYKFEKKEKRVVTESRVAGGWNVSDNKGPID